MRNSSNTITTHIVGAAVAATTKVNMTFVWTSDYTHTRTHAVDEMKKLIGECVSNWKCRWICLCRVIDYIVSIFITHSSILSIGLSIWGLYAVLCMCTRVFALSVLYLLLLLLMIHTTHTHTHTP